MKKRIGDIEIEEEFLISDDDYAKSHNSCKLR